MKLIAVTGGISCGKSTAISLIENMNNVVIVDSDKIGKRALDVGERPYEQLKTFIESSEQYKSKFNEIFDQEQGGIVNREVLGSLVFADSSLRKSLNGMTHGWIFRKIIDEIWAEWKSSNYYDDKVVVLDSPLFFETKVFKHICSKVIVITTTDENQKNWLMNRNNLSEQEAENRIRAQMPNSEKEKLADYVVRNDSDLETFKQRVTETFEQCRADADPIGFLAASTLTAFRGYSQFC